MTILIVHSEWESHEPGYFSVALFDHRKLSRCIDAYVVLNTLLVDMPICDGVEACKRVRVLENKRRAPILLPSMLFSFCCSHSLTIYSLVVALSADCQESTKQLCLSAGMNSFLSKPLKRSQSPLISVLHLLTACCYLVGDLVSLLSMFGPPPGKPPDGPATAAPHP